MQEKTKNPKPKLKWQIPVIAISAVVILGTLILRPKKEHPSVITLHEEVARMLREDSANAPAVATTTTPPTEVKKEATKEVKKETKAPAQEKKATTTTKKSSEKASTKTKEASASASSNLLYGIERSNYKIKQGEVAKGQSLSKLIGDYVGGKWSVINNVVEESKPIFDLTNVKVGNKWTIFYNTYNGEDVMDYFAYEYSKTEVIVVSFTGGEISCTKVTK